MKEQQEQQAAVYVGTHSLMKFVAEISHRMAQTVHDCDKLGDFLPQEVRFEIDQLHAMQITLTSMLARLSEEQRKHNGFGSYRRGDR